MSTNAGTAILQTRPQGEKSAEANLERRGIRATRPREIVVTRKRQANGKRVDVEKEVTLMPGYIVAEPNDGHQLDVALGDMAMREPRKDVQRVVGWASEESMKNVMDKHMKRVEPARAKIEPKSICEILGGPMANEDKPFKVKVKMLGRHEALCDANGLTMRIPLEYLRPAK